MTGDEVPAQDVPSQAELERLAVPATVRRAPRYRAFAVAGALVGVLLGVLVVLVTGVRRGEQAGAVLTFLVVGLALLGSLVGGLLAVLADRRSNR